MLAISGIFLVFVEVFGGYILEHSNPFVLMQPAEILIELGGPRALRWCPTAWRPFLRCGTASGGPFVRRLIPADASFAICGCSMRYFIRAAGGIVKPEDDREKPAASRIFSRYAEFLHDQTTRHFVCRMLVIGVTTPARRGYHESAGSLSAIADALPGLEIAAAVVGVVITMQAIGGSPETVGQKVAAALVGTLPHSRTIG